jgi:hypothetical protein
LAPTGLVEKSKEHLQWYKGLAEMADTLQNSVVSLNRRPDASAAGFSMR